MRLRLTCRASVDDAHAAPGDLLEQLVIAEVPDRFSRLVLLTSLSMVDSIRLGRRLGRWW